ncbi:hypothetical protein HOY82DRAFT_374663 [Tuber indicum]|nr:hypothetical protein HOY82DRAFT_374663 [Tuber indicum]
MFHFSLFLFFSPPCVFSHDGYCCSFLLVSLGTSVALPHRSTGMRRAHDSSTQPSLATFRRPNENGKKKRNKPPPFFLLSSQKIRRCVFAQIYPYIIFSLPSFIIFPSRFCFKFCYFLFFLYGTGIRTCWHS